MERSLRFKLSFESEFQTCTEFCRKILASEGESGPTFTLPKKAPLGQEKWMVVSRGAKRRIESDEEEEEDAKRRKRAPRGGRSSLRSCVSWRRGMSSVRWRKRRMRQE